MAPLGTCSGTVYPMGYMSVFCTPCSFNDKNESCGKMAATSVTWFYCPFQYMWLMKCQLMLSQVCSVTVIIMCCSLLCDTKFNLNDSPLQSRITVRLLLRYSDIYTWSEISIGKNQLRSYIFFNVGWWWPAYYHEWEMCYSWGYEALIC